MRLLWLSMIYIFGVIHTAVTDFDSVAVKYLAEAVILRESFVN